MIQRNTFVFLAALTISCGQSQWTILTDGTWSEAEIEATSVYALATFAESAPELSGAEGWVGRSIVIAAEPWEEIERDCGQVAWGCWYEKAHRLYFATSTPTQTTVPTLARTALVHEWMHATLQFANSKTLLRESRAHACPWFYGEGCEETDIVTATNASLPDMLAFGGEVQQ
jgi:hypothetical protein